MSEEGSQDNGSAQGSEEGALEGENVALRKARQKAYRARQREAAELLSKLWRLRTTRERGGFTVGLPSEPSWVELAALVRALIHEEELLAAAAVARSPTKASAPKGRGLVGAIAAEASASEASAGLSTLHIGTPSIGPLSTLHISREEKDAEQGRSDTPASGKQTPATRGSTTPRKRSGKKKGNGH